MSSKKEVWRKSGSMQTCSLVVIPINRASLVAQMVKSVCNVGDLGSIPRSWRYPGEGNGYPLQKSCLENSMDKEAWQAMVHCVTKRQTWPSDTLSDKVILLQELRGTSSLRRGHEQGDDTTQLLLFIYYSLELKTSIQKLDIRGNYGHG